MLLPGVKKEERWNWRGTFV